MHEEQIQTPNTRLHSDESLWGRTRKAALCGAVTVSTAIYGLSEAHEVPVSTHNILDVQEHAAHLAPSVALGYGLRVAAEKLPTRIKNHAAAVSITGVTLVASLFETRVSDLFWYRNTTKDVNDIAYSVAAGIIGAFCLRRKTKQRP